MDELIAACFGDKEKAIRLIEYDCKRDPTLKTMEATERALDRLCYDRGKGNRKTSSDGGRSKDFSGTSNVPNSAHARHKQSPPDVSMKIALPVLLACAVIIGFVKTASKSMKTKEQQQFQAEFPIQPSIVPARPQPPVGKSDAAPSNSESITLNPVPGHSSSVFKCIINGKTVYSDEHCGTPSTMKRLLMSDSSGFISPSKEKVEVPKRVVYAQEYQKNIQVQQAEIFADTKRNNCDVLSKRIDWLEGMARLPQSGQMQDWIKSEKGRIQGLQFELRC